MCTHSYWGHYAWQLFFTEYLFILPRKKKTSCHTLSQGFKESRIQSLRDSRTQGLKHSRTQGFRHSRTQGPTDGKTQWFMFGHLFQDNHTRLSRTQALDPPRAKHTKTPVPKHWSANINLDKSKNYLKHETAKAKTKNDTILDSGRKKLRKCQRHLLYAAQGIPRINNNASAPFPPAPPNLILQSGRFSLAKLFPGKGKIFRDNLELSILNWGVRGVTKQNNKIKASRFYLQSFFRPQ